MGCTGGARRFRIDPVQRWVRALLHGGGRVSGLQGPGLVLRLEAGSDTDALAIAGNGRYAFRLQLAEGQAYRVSVQAQPAAGPHCRVFNASGVLALASATDADVACSDGLSWDAGVWGEDWR